MLTGVMPRGWQGPGPAGSPWAAGRRGAVDPRGANLMTVGYLPQARDILFLGRIYGFTQAEQGLLQQPPPLAEPVTLTPQAMPGLILWPSALILRGPGERTLNGSTPQSFGARTSPAANCVGGQRKLRGPLLLL